MLRVATKDDKIIFIGQLFKNKSFSKSALNSCLYNFKKKIANESVKKSDGRYRLYLDAKAVKKRIVGLIESNIVSRVASKKLDNIFGIFLLKATQKWVETQHTLKIQKDINVKYSIALPKLEKQPRIVDVSKLPDKPKE